MEPGEKREPRPEPGCWCGGGCAARDLPWLAAAIAIGGVLGPVLLMTGLAHLAAAEMALLLNLESVFTALLAWFVFREHFDRRIVLGMTLIVAGGVALSWSAGTGAGVSLWALVVAGACLAWVLDNNLTRKVSAGGPVLIAGLKGLVAGLTNTGIALAIDHVFPAAPVVAAATAVGLFGYGVSLALFVLALRHLGTARTGAYFSTAPFIGVGLALLLWPEMPGFAFWLAAALMAAGVWRHLTERHEHEHAHEPLAHTHRHMCTTSIIGTRTNFPGTAPSRTPISTCMPRSCTATRIIPTSTTATAIFRIILGTGRSILIKCNSCWPARVLLHGCSPG